MERAIRNKRFATEPAGIPKHEYFGFSVRELAVRGRKAWIVTPEHGVAAEVILYIHGGGYIGNLTKYDWDFIRQIALRTNASIIVADYPLAPASNYKDVYAYFEELYGSMIHETQGNGIVFLGNSAGGGIALGFTQKLRDEGKPLPSLIVLNSPWLDITMSNPQIASINGRDKLLGVEGLRMAGQAYAAGLDVKNPLVSPIYGKLEGLPRVALFIGTHDVFLADTRKLKHQLKMSGVPIEYFEYPKMFHVWMAVTGLKESRHAIDQMAALIKVNLRA